MDLKGIRRVNIKREVKDPVRYPKVIDKYENQSKKDFWENLEIEQEHLFKEMKSFAK